ncbi:MAG TPA: ABC transporter substrate-binding protein [Anaerolineae bacterium]|nr:ABC transporter substrate-binding protein [Anaerolineae bacterium]HMR67341.1 ABC transporter substrate-binding protein [Anaerolineae bacterium]
MSVTQSQSFSRRHFLKAVGGAAVAYAATPLLSGCGAGSRPTGAVRIGLLLPFSDIYAVLGESIREGIRMYFDQVNNEAGGRPLELIIEDTEIQPDVAQQKARKLVEQDQVDLLAGVVSSGVLISLRDYVHENKKLLICANAGANQLSRELKTPYIWRTSFTNWMIHWPIGGWAAENVGRRAYVSVPDYAAGENAVTAFTHNFEANGGEVVGVQRTPFPNMGDPAPFIAELAQVAPDFVYGWYSGSSAVTFVKAYHDFGLGNTVPLVTSGFTVGEDVLPAQGEAALGIHNSLHWVPRLENPDNQLFTAAYRERTGKEADVYNVQGYDTGRVIVDILNAVGGDTSDTDKMVETLGGINFNSPRGPFALDSNSQAPRQNMYLCQVQEVDGNISNVVLGNLGEVVDPGDDSKG